MNRGIPLSGDSLREARRTLGWSQSDLATRAGLSVRVIAKAEAGLPVALSTRQALRAAFAEVGIRNFGYEVTDFIPTQQVANELIDIYRSSFPNFPTRSQHLLSYKVQVRFRRQRAVTTVYGTREFDRLWTKLSSSCRRQGGCLDDRSSVSVLGRSVAAGGIEYFRPSPLTEWTPWMVLLHFVVGPRQVEQIEIQADRLSAK